MAKSISRSALIPYSAQQMFELVNDINSFPQFMDGCVGSEVLVERDNFMEARLDLRKGKFEQSFTTRNQLYPGERIEMNLAESSSLKSLFGKWDFKDLSGQGCKVSLHLEFEFKNRLFAMAAEPLFEKIANQLVDSVCARAESIYS